MGARTRSPYLAAGLYARKLVAPFVSQINPWQEGVARVTARMEASGTGPLERDGLLARANELQLEVSRCLNELNDAVSTAPPEVAGHSRIADVQHALVGLLERIDQIRPRAS